MKIDDQLLDKLSKLARLKIPDEKRDDMKKDLSNIISWMEKLDEIDTSDIEPLTNMSDEINSSREDVIGTHMDRNKMLSNAPDSDSSFINVPLVKKNK